MGRARWVTVGEGLRLEHVVTRNLLRLVGITPPVEIPIDVLIELGVDTSSAQQYLLFGGVRRRGGTMDLLGVYRSEDKARQAFQDVRTRGEHWWGELVALDATGRRRKLGWFDAGQPGGSAPKGEGAQRWWKRP